MSAKVHQLLTSIAMGVTWSKFQRMPAPVGRCLNCLQNLSLDPEPIGSPKVEAIQVHHLIPGRYKVMDKLLLGVRTSVDFRQGPELGV